MAVSASETDERLRERIEDYEDEVILRQDEIDFRRRRIELLCYEIDEIKAELGRRTAGAAAQVDNTSTR